MEVIEDTKKGQAMKQMSNVKSLRELGIEFGMPNASKREIAKDREIESMDEYVAIWQWYGENADWQLMEEIVEGPNYINSQYSFMHTDSPEYQRLWENTWRT